MTNGLGSAWSVLREPLTFLSFPQMKEAAAAAGLNTSELSGLRQSSTGRSTSKAELADAIDGLFNRLPGAEKDRAALYMIVELLRRCPPERHARIEELLERRGWLLLDGEPVPADLRLDPLPEELPDAVRDGILKAVRRYRDGDLDGAITAIVGTIDSLTEAVYLAEGRTDHRTSAFHQRVVTAHHTLESSVRESLGAMDPAEADRTWGAQERAVNGAAEVLASYRRNFSDAHGAADAAPEIVAAALHAGLFVAYSLSP